MIERATFDDAEIICDIRDRAWLKAYPNTELGITEDDVRLSAQGPNGEFVPRRIAHLKEQLAKDEGSDMGIFVAKIEDRVVGYAGTNIDEHGRKFIDGMYVSPEEQGKGIGGKLMDHVLTTFGTEADIYLEVVAYNDKAIGFYEHYGFEKTDAVVPEEEGRPTYLKTFPQSEMVLRSSSM